MQIVSGVTTQGLQHGSGETAVRWSAEERAQIYHRVVGLPGGDTGGTSNREFNDLWLRFVSSVVQFNRPQTVSALVPQAPRSLSSASVQSLARDLAAACGPSIVEALSARDMWQVIDHVDAAELGGAVNPTRYRSMAAAGGTILDVLANRNTAANGADPTDVDLVQAAEQWLAVSGVSDAEAQSMSQPEATQRITAWSESLHAALSPGSGDARPDLRVAKGAVLFTGSSGSGKTLAAHWLATSLGRDVLHIDLSQVVSKYIGETEKNLAAVFGRAQQSGAILLFDEADALFGKRSNVHDAHDRYANQETNYLLQRIEAHEGLVILATNQSKNIDPDLLKKLRAVVAFPLPPRP